MGVSLRRVSLFVKLDASSVVFFYQSSWGGHVENCAHPDILNPLWNPEVVLY